MISVQEAEEEIDRGTIPRVSFERESISEISMEYPACRISAWHIDLFSPLLLFIDTDIVPICGFLSR